VVASALGTYNHWDAQFLGEKKPVMSREQLDEWLAAGMEVGSHSWSHPQLHQLPPQAAWYEIAESRAALGKLLGVPIEHFAYPYGHYTPQTLDLVRRAGYRSAVTALPGVARSSDDWLLLPRILVNGEHGLWRFLLRLAASYARRRVPASRAAA